MRHNPRRKQTIKRVCVRWSMLDAVACLKKVGSISGAIPRQL